MFTKVNYYMVNLMENEDVAQKDTILWRFTRLVFMKTLSRTSCSVRAVGLICIDSQRS